MRSYNRGTKRGVIILNPKIFPIILIVLDVLASLSYGIDGDIRRCIYWLSAGILTATVTF